MSGSLPRKPLIFINLPWIGKNMNGVKFLKKSFKVNNLHVIGGEIAR